MGLSLSVCCGWQHKKINSCSSHHSRDRPFPIPGLEHKNHYARGVSVLNVLVRIFTNHVCSDIGTHCSVCIMRARAPMSRTTSQSAWPFQFAAKLRCFYFRKHKLSVPVQDDREPSRFHALVSHFIAAKRPADQILRARFLITSASQ